MIGSHNSWSYLKPTKWWMRLFAFTAKCQTYDIKTQYNDYGVRMFDLRIRFDEDGSPIICHGLMEYKYDITDLYSDLNWLDSQEDVTIRYLLELRGNYCNTEEWQREQFIKFYENAKFLYRKLNWAEGRDLPDFDRLIFDIPEVNIVEKYSSVCPPKIIDDWWPWLYAKLHNKKNKEKYKNDNCYLLIDYVNI